MNILHVNRFAIYVYWDPQGILRDYALYFVRELKKNCSRVVFIANGFLSSQAKKTLLEEGIEVHTRKNFGYDFYAYKFGLDILSPSLQECDELILSNSSVYGPFIPFEKILTKMDDLRLDFWGISSWKGDPWPTHIQSYFLAFRNKILVSEHFTSYWNNLPPIKNRQEAIEYAMKNAEEGDIILLIGKGHEQYQEIKGVQYYWDEREAVERAQENINKRR